MMYNHIIARRYAKGLLLSITDKNYDEILSELKAFARIYADPNKELQRLCEDPSFTPFDRKAVITKIAAKAGFHSLLLKFLLLLIDKGRIALIELIYLSFARMVDHKEGRIRVRITSASSMEDEEVDEIKNILGQISKKEVLAETAMEKGLLGGIRVETSGTVFDGTLRAKLSLLENLLLNDIGQ